MKHLEGCPSGDFGPCDCGKPMTSNASDDLVTWLEMIPLSACGIAAKEITSLRAQLAAAKTDAKNFGEQMCATNDRLIAAQDQIQTARTALRDVLNASNCPYEVAREALRSLDGAGK